MKRFFTFGVVVMTLLALALSGCSHGGSGPVDTSKITAISLSVFREGLDPSSEMPDSMENGAVRIFTAAVTGTGEYNKAYTIAVTGDGVTAVDYESIPGAKKVTATADTGSFTVTATAAGDSSIQDSWTIDLTEATEPEITGIALRRASAPGQTPVAANPFVMENGAALIFSAVVSGTGEYDLAYSIAVEATDEEADIDELVTVVKNEDGTVTVTAIADEGEFKVIATAAGDETVTATWTIELAAVGAGSSAPDFSNAQWKILNTAIDRGVSLNGSTTTTVPFPNADKRYVIFNNEPGALIDQDTSLATPAVATENNHFKDVTIMYLDIPFVADLVNYKSVYFEARVRISKWRDTAPIFGSQIGQGWASVRQGVIMGMIENPEELNITFNGTGSDALATNGKDAPAFIGQRLAAGGQKRGYLKRASNEYGSQTPSPGTSDVQTNIPGTTKTYHGEFNSNDYVDATMNNSTTKEEGFADQEYIYRVMRTGPTVYSFQVYNRMGNTLLFSYPLTGTSNVPHPKLVGTDPVYLAFMVYGVEAEISDVKVYYNDEVAWADPAVAGAIPMTPRAKWVSLTASVGQKFPGDTDNDYSCLVDQFPASVTLNYKVYPVTVNPTTVLWSVEDGDCVDVDEGTVTRVSGKSGYATVVATPVAGGNAGKFKFYLMDPANAAAPTGVAINAPALAILNYGNNAKDKVKLSATVAPGNALQNVTWAITSGGDVATIDADTGVLKAKSVLADTEVTVTATATADTSIVSAPVTITVKKDDDTRQWTFGPGTLAPWVDSSAGNVNTAALPLDYGLTLTPPTGGARWYSGQAGLSNVATPPYMGYYNPASVVSVDAGGWGKIEGITGSYTVTMIASNTGDSFQPVGSERYMWIKFADDTVSQSTWNAGPSNGSADTATGKPDGGPTGIDYYSWKVTGTGTATFGATGALRVWAILVTPSDYVPPEPPDPPDPPGDTTIWKWVTGDIIPTTTAQTINGKTVYASGGVSKATDHEQAPNNSMILGNGRLAVGLPENPTYNSNNGTPFAATTDTNGAYVTNAELDLSKKFTITVKWGRLTGTNFSLNLNNYAGSNNGGVLKGNGVSGVVPNANGTIFSLPGTTNTLITTTYTIDPANLVVSTAGAGLTPPVIVADVISNQFIQFRADSSSSVWIEEITLEYVE